VNAAKSRALLDERWQSSAASAKGRALLAPLLSCWHCAPCSAWLQRLPHPP